MSKKVGPSPARKPKESSANEGASKKSAGRNQHLKALIRISDLINSTVNYNTLLRRIVRESIDVFSATGGFIALADQAGKGLQIEVNLGIDHRDFKTGHYLQDDSIASVAVNKNEVIQHTEKKAGIAHIATPLRADGQTIGAMLLARESGKAYSEEDERLLLAIGTQAARMIHTSRLYERLAQQGRRLETLLELGQLLISTDPLPEILNRVTESLLQILDVKQCTVLLVGKGHDLQLSASSGGAGTYAQRRENMDSIVEKLSARGEPVRFLDVKKMEGRRPGKLPRQERLSTLLAVPIFYQHALVGILNVYTGDPREFQQEEMRLLKSYATLCGVAIENARRHERLLAVAEEIRMAERTNSLYALAGEIAKEVRNPLTATHLVLDALHEEGAFPPGQGQDYEQLVENISRISSAVGRIETLGARRTPQLEWLEINRVVEDVLALCHHRLAARQILVNRRFTSDLPRVLADKGDIQQVILQCVSNAMESMRHGGIMNLATTLVAGPDDRGGIPMVRVNVRDTGSGLDPTVSEDIFDPFGRSKDNRAGFGLFVAWRIAQRYGGRLTARNATDHGASVSLTLPALESQS